MNSKIVFDTDCLSSFLCTGSEDILLKLYEDRIIIPDMVFKEFEKLKMSSRMKFIWIKLNKYLYSNEFQLYEIKLNTQTYQEFVRLTTHPYQIGEGEAATIAIVTTVNGYTASNNFKDIQQFIETGYIDNKTTVDILCEAYIAKVRTLEELEKLRIDMIDNWRRKLPNITIKQELKNRKIIE